jgi:signal transduction histidine kinase
VTSGLSRAAASVASRLVLLQVFADVGAAILTSVFAPRVLLLSASASVSARLVVAAVTAVSACLISAISFVRLRRSATRLSTLEATSSAYPPETLRSLSDAPWTLSVWNVGVAAFVGLSSVALGGRPMPLSVYNHAALVALFLLLLSTVTLGTYVMARVQVSRVLERVPPVVMERALSQLERHVRGRVRKRFVAAVTLPVLLVALSATLLSNAHVQTRHERAWQRDTESVAAAAFEPLDIDAVEDDVGRDRANAALAKIGFDSGRVSREAPLEIGVSSVFWVCVIVSWVASLLAAILASRIAEVFDRDVEIATREVLRAGDPDNPAEAFSEREPRFKLVDSLLDAVDELRSVFGEFERAQRHAIESRGAIQRMRGLLFASMSHDLRAPLNAVLGFTELVRRNPLTKPQHESLAIIEHRGRELLWLLETILDSARAEAGELSMETAPSVVSDVVMAAVLESRTLSAVGDGVFVPSIQPSLPLCSLDALRFVQGLTAVLMMAVRFRGDGVVSVRAYRLEEETSSLCLEVESSGKGLPTAERETLFEAFGSADRARRQGGLGLGLRLALSIVVSHGGSMVLVDNGTGTLCFRMVVSFEGPNDAPMKSVSG